MSAKSDFYDDVDTSFPDNVAEAIGADDMRARLKQLGGSLFDTFGNLDLLETADKTGLVTAINEINNTRWLASAVELSAYSGNLTKKQTADGRWWSKVPSTGLTPNVGTVVSSATSGFVWQYVPDGFANVKHFGAKGDASTNDAAAIQAAINYVGAHANAGAGLDNASEQRPATLYFPAGSYHVAQSLEITGPIRIVGEGGLSFGGTRLYMTASNLNLFNLTGSGEGGNLAVQFSDVRLGAVGSGTPTKSLVFSDHTGSKHSLYFDRVWFQGWEKYALEIQKSDDLQVVRCTFDGATNQAFALGRAFDAASIVSNAVFSGNTFYDIRGGIGYLLNVDGLIWESNRIVGTAANQIPFVLDNLSFSALPAKRLQITGNISDYANIWLKTKSGDFSLTGGVATHCTSRMLEFSGGGVIGGVKAIGFHWSGIWTGSVDSGGGVLVPDAPIFGLSTGLIGSHLSGIISSTGTSPTGIYLPDSRTAGNFLDEMILSGFTTDYNVANLSGNRRLVAWALTHTTATIGPGGLSMTAGEIIAADLTGVTGALPGDYVSLARVGGWGAMPIEIECRVHVLEANKVRLYIHNTATTGKVFIESQLLLKLIRCN